MDGYELVDRRGQRLNLYTQDTCVENPAQLEYMAVPSGLEVDAGRAHGAYPG